MALLLFLATAPFLTAQKRMEKKYPALLWEITGNGLKKPSYLFGTMHVSSKMVFHLSDSFYLGIKSSDMVALELDPQLWQDQLFRFQNMQSNLRSYTQGSPGDYLNEKSFQLEKYEEALKVALSEEPAVINGLLYRTYQNRADFEEDTYLDLYIYQTGKKLGKQATGVENYFETEKLIMEAAQDMMKDKRRRNTDNDEESLSGIEKRTQEAYRKGDLDLLDSLEKIMQPSDAFMEKFLYRRNEIQANSIDSIIRGHSLFAGVGAAHLPGKRGVIELLRKKGYTLRPVGMQDREAARKDDIDKIRVPVRFTPFTAGDSAFSVQLPGKLYRREDNRMTDSWQYADMGNGAYYMISRVRTHAAFLGQKEEVVLAKIDSLLYENIPGKILKKTPLLRDGYRGFDITSKTRRGDIQRYNILVTPSEAIVFKMSGTGNYTEGKEADQFFGSIEIKKNDQGGWADFSPPQGGFSVRMPHILTQNRNTTAMDGVTRWEYEANDTASAASFLVWKKTIQNYRFLEEDTADLALMEESFLLSDRIEKQLYRRTGLYKGNSSLDGWYLARDGSTIRARFLIRGPHYYLLAARSRNKDRSFPEFFNSFAFTPYRYRPFRNYTDTFLNIRVTTPVTPDFDPVLRAIIEKAGSEEFLNSLSDYINYWPRTKTALFQDDSTGEAVFLSMETFPKYYYPKDSLSFWTDQTSEKKMRQDLQVRSKAPLRVNDSVGGFRYIFTDTNSSRAIKTWLFLKDNRLFRMTSLDDSSQVLRSENDFAGRFYSSLQPLDKRLGPSVFTNKLDLFFKDFYSSDSSVSKRAKEAIPNVYFGAAGVPGLLKAIASLSYNGKDYFATKTRLISELGYIDDSLAVKNVVEGLKAIYEKAADTGTLQNAVLKALAHHKTHTAYELLKTLLAQDPPVFDNAVDYNAFFSDLGDSLALARSLFPGLFQLAAVNDYKENIRSLLTELVDSGYMKAADYESWFTQLYFDAKIQWKKQEGRDERKLQKKDEEADPDLVNIEGERTEDTKNELENYAILLMPFYVKNPTVPHFFDKLLRSGDASVRMSTALLLLRNSRPVADSILQTLAASDQYRNTLLKSLQAIHKQDRFPRSSLNQVDIARSQLVASRGDHDFFAIQPVDKKMIQFRKDKGYIYFFKYKITKEDEWQMGFSGLQPANGREVLTTTGDFINLTGKKLRPGTAVQDQFNEQLKRLLLSRRRSAASFYMENEPYAPHGDED